MRAGFLLDPDVVYFNHGAYGACAVDVFDEYQRLQRELERDPTDFFVRRFEVAMHWAQKATPSWSRSHCRTALAVSDTWLTRARLSSRCTRPAADQRACVTSPSFRVQPRCQRRKRRRNAGNVNSFLVASKNRVP